MWKSAKFVRKKCLDSASEHGERLNPSEAVSLSQNLVSGGVGTPLQVGQKRAQSPKVETSKRQCPEVVNRIKVGMWVYQSVWLVIHHTVILHILCIWYAFIIFILYQIEPYRLYLCLLLTLTPIKQCIYLCYWLIKCNFSVLYKSRFLSSFRLILQDLVTQFFSFGSQGKREGGERKSRDGSQPGDFLWCLPCLKTCQRV